MDENAIVERIKTLCAARSWSYYRLAKESGITYSTLCTMLHKANAPSLPTLFKICEGFGITPAQFFNEKDDHAMLTSVQLEHLKQWNRLSAEQQQVVDKYIQFLLSEHQ